MTEKEDFIPTKYKCPICGEIIYKGFHRYDNYRTQRWDYRWFHCLKNMCEIGCLNCRFVDSHGECSMSFCHNRKKWKPEVKK